MKKSICAVFAILLTAVLLMGCGKGGGAGEKTGGGETESASVSSGWKEKGFQVAEKVDEEIAFWPGQFTPWDHNALLKDPKAEQLYAVGYPDVHIHGGKIYRLEAISNAGRKDTRTVLEIYDTAAGESEAREITSEEMGVEPAEGSLLQGMDVLDDEQFVFFYKSSETNEENQSRPVSFQLVYTDLKGNGEAAELLPALAEKGIVKEDFSSEDPFLALSSLQCDGRGNLYIETNNRGRGNSDIYVFDRSGKCLAEYQGGEFQYVGEPLRTGEGDMIYGIYDRDGSFYRFCWVDTEAGELRTLCQANSRENIQKLLEMRGSDLYYQSYTGIVRWNVETGKRTEILSLEENAALKAQNVELIFREGKAPLLRTFQDAENKSWLVELSDTKAEEEEAVRVMDLVNSASTVGVDTGHQQMAQCVTLTNMEDPNTAFVYESASKDYDNIRDRTLTELAAGKGPDILYVTRDDLEILADKGVLMDLKGLLPEGAVEEILPGALELGTVDGKLVGLPANIFADTAVVSRDVWPEDSWTLEDWIGLVEAGKLEPLISQNGGGYFWPLATVRILTERNLENSFLIDWENRVSHFDDERFVRLLELTDVVANSLETDEENLLKGGKRAALQSLSGERSGVTDFGLAADRENGHYVGMPMEDQGGNYIDTSGLLVVNAATEKQEEIKTFLEVFLSEEVQREIPYSCLTGQGISIMGLSKDWIQYDADGTPLLRGEELTVFENGETSLDRAQAFLMKCKAAPKSYGDLSQILYEELDALYNGGRDIESTVKILNNRIQLYLNEQE